MGIQNGIWFSIIMYMLAAVALGIVTYLWLTYRLKKKQRDDAARHQTTAAHHDTRTDDTL